MKKQNEITSALPPLRPVRVVDVRSGEVLGLLEHDNVLGKLVEYVQGIVEGYPKSRLFEDLKGHKGRIAPAEWARQNNHLVPVKTYPSEMLGKSRVQRLIAHKLVSESLSYVNNPNPRKQLPSYAPKINLGSADKQLVTLSSNDNKLSLLLKAWDRELLMEFTLPPYLNQRNIKKWCLPTIEFHNGQIVYRFSIIEETKVRNSNKYIAGIDLGRIEPATIVVINESNHRVADYKIRGNARLLNIKCEALLNNKKHIINKIKQYDALGLDSTVLKLESTRITRKASVLSTEISRLTASQVTKLLMKHSLNTVHVENLKWVTGSKYGSKWAHSQVQSAMEHSLAREGIKVKKVNARNTSQSCSKCGNKIIHNSRKRTVHCIECKIVLDRDYNAAINIARNININHCPVPERRNGSNCSSKEQVTEENLHNSNSEDSYLKRMKT